jgi:hypothetical protein
MTAPVVLPSNTWAPVEWVSAPIELDLRPDEPTVIQHDLGRRVGWVVVSANGPAAYWETDTADPYRLLGLKASVAVRARICLV